MPSQCAPRCSRQHPWLSMLQRRPHKPPLGRWVLKRLALGLAALLCAQLMSCGLISAPTFQSNLVVQEDRLKKRTCRPIPPPSKDLVSRSSDPEVIALYATVIVLQNGVISKCIEEMDAQGEYLKKVDEGIKRK